MHCIFTVKKNHALTGIIITRAQNIYPPFLTRILKVYE